jgi:hypothetical protein
VLVALIKNSLVLWVLIASPLYCFASHKAGSINHQTEAGFKITEAAARAILNLNDFKESKREDFYVDIYDGQHFLLSDNRFKLRLKVSDDKSIVQANTKMKILPSQCEQGWKYNVLVKKIGELNLAKKETQYFKQAVSSQLDLILNGSQADVKQQLLSFNKFIRSLPVPLLEKLLDVPQTPRWLFVPAYLSTKKKWTSLLNFNSKEIEVSIGEVRQYVGSTYFDSNFEVEFQFKNEDMNIEDFKSALCAYLQKNALRETDFAADGLDPQQETLKRLKFYNSILGLEATLK